MKWKLNNFINFNNTKKTDLKNKPDVELGEEKKHKISKTNKLCIKRNNDNNIGVCMWLGIQDKHTIELRIIYYIVLVHSIYK